MLLADTFVVFEVLHIQKSYAYPHAIKLPIYMLPEYKSGIILCVHKLGSLLNVTTAKQSRMLIFRWDRGKSFENSCS